jgi:predicted NAD/FAD-binding protein
MSIPKHCSNYDLAFNYELITELVCSTIDIISYCDYVGVGVKAENGVVEIFDKCILSTKDITNVQDEEDATAEECHILGAFKYSTRYKTSD